jgi:hypothetical protein
MEAVRLQDHSGIGHNRAIDILARVSPVALVPPNDQETIAAGRDRSIPLIGVGNDCNRQVCCIEACSAGTEARRVNIQGVCIELPIVTPRDEILAASKREGWVLGIARAAADFEVCWSEKQSVF